MPLTGEAKRLWDRNNMRTKRYGNWRQLFYNAWGMCEQCSKMVNLDIHEEMDNRYQVKGYKLLCIGCHSELEGGNGLSEHFVVERRKYASKMREDILAEVEKHGLDGWKEKFKIVDKDAETMDFWVNYVAMLKESDNDG